jgi:predicted transcriptional regulator
MGELEAAVMNVLWDHGGALTPGEVHERLVSDRPLAYTTIMTILVRLWQKGLLERRRDRRAFAYHPVHSRAEYAARRMQDVLESAGNKAEALASFVGTMGRSERAQLRRLLDRLNSR